MQQTLMEYVKDILPEIAKHTMKNPAVTPEMYYKREIPPCLKFLMIW